MNKTVYRIMSAMVAFALTFGSYASVSASQKAMITSYGKNNSASMPALQTSGTRMLIPLYIYPSVSAWANVVDANLYNNIDVIINPANGVGVSKSTAYANGVIQLRTGNLGVFGYVYTLYGARPLATAKAEIDNWQLWYGVDGIFLDEADNTSSMIPYYTDLWNYITAKGMKVILNPGTNTIEGYVSVATTNVIYESDPSKALSVPSWFANYPASEFGFLQYAATVEQMRIFVPLAKSKNIGYIYITDAITHFWSSLPSYLAEEAALLASEVVTPTLSSATFSDAPVSYWANSYIELLYNAGITGGCSSVPLNYCPDNTITRAQMAVFLLKSKYGSSYNPPATGDSTGFGDVETNYWAATWIKQLAAEGITGGCGDGNYCPDATVTRAQMAIFLLKAKYGSQYSPPAASGAFTDVAVGYWARNWIEQLAVEGVTGGCGVGVYCPDNSVTRAHMAVFLVKTFNLP